MPRCEQRIDELVGREWLHVLGRFSDPDEPNRHPDAIGNAEKNATLRAAVQLCNGQPCKPQRLVEFFSLDQRILSLACIEHEHDFVRRGFIAPADHAFDLGKFVHQAGLALQAAGRVSQENIYIASTCRIHGVEYDGRRIGAGMLRDDRHIVAVTPGLKLLDGCGPKGIAGRQHDRETLFLEATCKFANRRGFSGAVNADHQDDVRTVRLFDRQRSFDRTQDLAQGVTQPAPQGLDDLQQAAVAEVVHSNSTLFLADRFAAKYGRSPNWGTADKYGYRRDLSPLAFFFYGGVMPDDLKARLETFVPKPTKAKVKTLSELPAAYGLPWSRWNPKTRTEDKGTEEVPLAVHQSELTAQRELLSVLRLIDSGKVSVSDKTRRPSAGTIKAVTNVLEDSDYYPVLPVKSKWHDENAGPIRAFAWPLIVQAGGLAQLSGSKLQLTKVGRNALSQPPGQTVQRLWSKWIDTTLIDELSRVACIKGQTGKGKRGLTALSSRRDAIADTLAECPAGSWISTDEFLRFVRASGNEFAVARNAWDLYIGEKRYGSLGYEGGEQILDERYLLAFLLEYAATLGVIDVALIPPAGARPDYGGLWGTDELVYFSRYDGLMYFRITALGACCLGADTEYKPAPVETKPVLRVLPNLEITAIGAELDQGDRIALDTYATQVSDLVWRLDQARLLAAVEEGRSVNEVREFLTARSSVAMPDTVSRLLDDVEERSTKVQDQGLAVEELVLVLLYRRLAAARPGRPVDVPGRIAGLILAQSDELPGIAHRRGQADPTRLQLAGIEAVTLELAVESLRCIGCRICEYACNYHHDMDCSAIGASLMLHRM